MLGHSSSSDAARLERDAVQVFEMHSPRDPPSRADSTNLEKDEDSKDVAETGVRDVPDAAAAAAAHLDGLELTPEEDRRILRKIGTESCLEPLRRTSLAYMAIVREQTGTFYPSSPWST